MRLIQLPAKFSSILNGNLYKCDFEPAGFAAGTVFEMEARGSLARAQLAGADGQIVPAWLQGHLLTRY
jgi:hypothetical protein